MDSQSNRVPISAKQVLGISEKLASPKRIRSDSMTSQLAPFSAVGQLVNAREQIKQELHEDQTYNWFQRTFTFHTVHDHTRRIHELLVQAQTEEHERAGTLFNLVMQGDLEGIKEKLNYERMRGKSSVILYYIFIVQIYMTCSLPLTHRWRI